MINIKRFEEVLNIEDITQRCERILSEVQPVLNGIIHDFVNMYSKEDNSLLDYELRTYEDILRSTYNESRDAKYREADMDKSIGTKDFSVLIKKFDNDVELFMLGITCYGESKTVHIGMEIEFDYLWHALRANDLEKIINNLSQDIKICLIETPFEQIPKEKFVEIVKTISKTRNRTQVFIGLEIPFEAITSEDSLVNDLWKVWSGLKNIREFNLDNGAKQSKSLGVLNLIKSYTEDLKINLYDHKYEVNFGETQKCKSRPGFFQKYLLNENGQMVTSGFINYYKKNLKQVYKY